MLFVVLLNTIILKIFSNTKNMLKPKTKHSQQMRLHIHISKKYSGCHHWLVSNNPSPFLFSFWWIVEICQDVLLHTGDHSPYQATILFEQVNNLWELLGYEPTPRWFSLGMWCVIVINNSQRIFYLSQFNSNKFFPWKSIGETKRIVKLYL